MAPQCRLSGPRPHPRPTLSIPHTSFGTDLPVHVHVPARITWPELFSSGPSWAASQQTNQPASQPASPRRLNYPISRASCFVLTTTTTPSNLPLLYFWVILRMLGVVWARTRPRAGRSWTPRPMCSTAISRIVAFGMALVTGVLPSAHRICWFFAPVSIDPTLFRPPLDALSRTFCCSYAAVLVPLQRPTRQTYLTGPSHLHLCVVSRVPKARKPNPSNLAAPSAFNRRSLSVLSCVCRSLLAGVMSSAPLPGSGSVI